MVKLHQKHARTHARTHTHTKKNGMDGLAMHIQQPKKTCKTYLYQVKKYLRETLHKLSQVLKKGHVKGKKYSTDKI